MPRSATRPRPTDLLRAERCGGPARAAGVRSSSDAVGRPLADLSAARGPARPPTDTVIVALVLRIARGQGCLPSAIRVIHVICVTGRAGVDDLRRVRHIADIDDLAVHGPHRHGDGKAHPHRALSTAASRCLT